MANIFTEVSAYADKLKSRIAYLEKRSAAAPEGSLVCHSLANSVYYGVRTRKDGKRREHYLPLSEASTISSLAEKKYSFAVLPDLKKNLAAADSFLRLHTGLDENDLASDLDKAILSRCQGIFKTNDSYAKEWLSQKWSEKPYEEFPPQNPTMRGDLVRSKSEEFIANSLYRHGLIYLYEKPLYLPDFAYPLFPDFTILDLYTRSEIIWDHLGLLDDPDYLDKNMKKLRTYERNGYIVGRKLILTFETRTCPFSAVDAEHIIKGFFFDKNKGLFLP